jgi:hypothetical protein
MSSAVAWAVSVTQMLRALFEIGSPFSSFAASASSFVRRLSQCAPRQTGCATRVSVVPPMRAANRLNDPCSMNVRLTPREGAAVASRKKLDYISEQVSAGELVVRAMTLADREEWAAQHAAVEAKLTSDQRTRRAAALKARRAKPTPAS